MLDDRRQGNSGRPAAISPLQRAQIVELACLEPVAEELHITHWSADDLARQAVADGIVSAISAATIRRWCYSGLSGWPDAASGWCAPMRCPIARCSIEQQEFEYTRHGTVNILNFLMVHTGRMEATCLESNDAEHYVRALRHFRRTHRRLKGMYLIHDGRSWPTGARPPGRRPDTVPVLRVDFAQTSPCSKL